MPHEAAVEFGERLIEDARREQGCDGEDGSFADANTVEISKTFFTNIDDATNWLFARANRYGPLIFVHVYEPEKAYWAYGRWCRC